MGQDRASGAAGRLYGLKMGARIAKLLGARSMSSTSNEIDWNGRRAVIKACAPANDSFGVTATMLGRLDDIYGAFEEADGSVELWRVSPEAFRSGMRPSPSARNRGADTRLIRKRFVTEHGQKVRSFSAAEIAAGA